MVNGRYTIWRSLWASVSLAALAVIASTNSAEARNAQSIDLQAAALSEALAELSREAGVSIGAEGSLPDIRTPAIHGAHSVGAALERMLVGSGYRARKVGPRAWRIERQPAVLRVPEQRQREPVSPIPAAVAPEIVVTGMKRPQTLAGLPMAAVIVPLSAGGASEATHGSAAIAGEIEGLSLAWLGSGRNRMFLRGIADSAFNGESQTTVAVELDEARLTLSAPDPDIRLVDMERVEVLKGPQGALHGTGALAGVYRIVTRRAKPGETSASISAGAALTADGAAGTNTEAVANLPLDAGDKAAIRIVGYRTLEPGWLDTGERRNSNRTRVNGARVGLGIDPGSGWRFDGTGFVQSIEAADSNYVYRPKGRKRPHQLPEPHDNKLRHLAARLAREDGDLAIVLASAMTWHRLNSRFDATRGGDAFGLADPRYLEDRRLFHIWDSEARIYSNAGNVHWLLGISHLSARQRDETVLSGRADALVVDEENRRVNEIALFANASLPLAPDLRLDAGLRLHRNTFHEAEDGSWQHRHRHGLTPSLSLSWQPAPGHLGFLRYGSAIRQGDFDVASLDAAGTLKDDEVRTVEIGWRTGWEGGQLELGAWHSWWKDMQSDLPEGSGLFETQNVGDARVSGIEASIEQKLRPGLVFRAGGNTTRARLARSTLAFPLASRRLPTVPAYTLRASLEKTFELGTISGMVRLKARYVGPARLSFDPQYDASAGKVLETGIEIEARAGRFSAKLALQNVLDRRANSFPYGNPLRFLSSRLYAPQAPRQISLSISRSF